MAVCALTSQKYTLFVSSKLETKRPKLTVRWSSSRHRPLITSDRLFLQTEAESCGCGPPSLQGLSPRALKILSRQLTRACVCCRYFSKPACSSGDVAAERSLSNLRISACTACSAASMRCTNFSHECGEIPYSRIHPAAIWTAAKMSVGCLAQIAALQSSSKTNER
jgi:hypothetical protein